MIAAPAFVIGILVIFFALAFTINTGLEQIVKWRKLIIDASMDERLGKTSLISALIITAIVFYFISKGPAISGIAVLYGLIGLGVLVGVASFLNSGFQLNSKARTTHQKAALDVQRPNKDVITKTLNYDGRLIYFVGEPSEDFLIFKCPVCDQYYATSKAKYNIIFDCNKCKNTVQITRKPTA